MSKSSVLSPLGTKKKESPSKYVWKVVKVVLSALFVIAFSVSAQITYNFSRYSPFFVSGESMWPTLNYSSRYTSEDGTEDVLDPSTGDYRLPGTYMCDYGLMDSSDGFQSTLERFDIVVAYSSVPGINEDGSLNVVDSTLVIKRVMGLPGDSFYFVSEGDDLGDFYLKEAGSAEFSLVEQPFFDVESHPEWSSEDIESVEYAKGRGTVYRSGRVNEKFTYLGTPENPIVLGEGEYFLCGDNRGHSGDSRTKGAFLERQLVGRAIAIIGQATYVIPSGGSSSYHVNLFDYYLPWNYRWLVD